MHLKKREWINDSKNGWSSSGRWKLTWSCYICSLRRLSPQSVDRGSPTLTQYTLQYLKFLEKELVIQEIGEQVKLWMCIGFITLQLQNLSVRALNINDINKPPSKGICLKLFATFLEQWQASCKTYLWEHSTPRACGAWRWWWAMPHSISESSFILQWAQR